MQVSPQNDLLFDDLQDLHGASLNANAASDALGGGAVLGSDHNLHGADLNTLAAGSAELLVDHVNTGLCILGDCTGLTDLSALTALNADHGLSLTLLLNDLDAGQVLMELLIESGGTCVNTLQTCHALSALFNSKLLHKQRIPFTKFYYFVYIIQGLSKNSNGIFPIILKKLKLGKSYKHRFFTV